MGKRRVEMRMVKYILCSMFIGVTGFFILLFVERTSIVAAEPAAVRKPTRFEKMRLRALARIEALRRRITPEKRKPKKKKSYFLRQSLC